MSQAVLIMGVPMERANGMPYINVRVPEPIVIGQIFTIDDIQYEVHDAHEVTRSNQLQYVYVQEHIAEKP